MSKLKVTLVFDKCERQKWNYSIVEEIRKSKLITLKAIIHIREEYTFYGFLHDLKSLIYILFRICYGVEKIVFRGKHDPIEDWLKITMPVPGYHFPYKRKKSGFRFNISHVKRIKELNSDIILDLSVGSVFSRASSAADEQLDLTKFGVWFFRLSKLNPEYSSLYGFWETITNKGELSGSLCVINKGELKVIYNTYSYLHPYSIYKSFENHYVKLSDAFIRESESFVSNNYLYRKIVENEIKYTLPAESLFLLNVQLIITYITKLVNMIYNQYFTKTWTLINTKVEQSSDLLNINFNSVSEINKPRATDWADPFVINFNDKTYVFYEEIIKNLDSKGHICCGEFIPNKNALVNNQVVLTENFHLSFPFVFNHDGIYYMIPESMANKTISIFECIEFPYRWKFMKNLFEGVPAADTIVYYFEGYWWLFTVVCNRNIAYNYDELFLFYGKDLFGNWTPHPLNPVVSDVKTARCAGNIFILDNKMIRPSQNCQFRYGYGLNLNEIKTLNTKHYQEDRITYYSSKGTRFNSIHTFNSLDTILFSDAKRFIR